MTIAEQITHDFLGSVKKIIVANKLDIKSLEMNISYPSKDEVKIEVADEKTGVTIASMRCNFDTSRIKKEIKKQIHERIKESNIPIGQLDVNFKGEKAFIRDKITGRIVGEVDVKITMERYEPKKMTRSEVEKAILAYCDPVATPCKECKCYKKCVKKMPFEWLSNEGLQEYYEFLYGIKVEVKE